MNQDAIHHQALKLLTEWQRSDGSFAAWAGDDAINFKPTRQQPTIFPTILILDALAMLPGAEKITEKAGHYVRTQMHEQGSWGYWDRASQAATQEPYPDDLDDTACALAALKKADQTAVTSEHIGAFARLLVASEIRAGGPYNTWLVEYQKLSQWRHVDVAVNANIGYVLAQQGAYPKGLHSYISECIAEGMLKSDYYVGTAPVLYFLSRWYTGPAYEQLQQLVKTQIKHTAQRGSLEAALLLLSAKHLHLPQSFLTPLFNELQKSFGEQGWPAEAFYVDPMYDGKQHYSGSAALTTAFALHALTFEPVRSAPARNIERVTTSETTSLRHGAQEIHNKELRRHYTALARQITAGDARRQITAPATIIAEAGNFKVAHKTLNILNQASLSGWVAYTIYDDFLDGEGQPHLLNVANMAHRRSYRHYLQALPDSQQFELLIEQAFDAMDSANAWELAHTRATVRNDLLKIRTLPDYGDMQVLADRSWGHSLAAAGVVLSVFNDANHQYFNALQTFFKHFLIARQCNDDAHDWQDDLRRGQLSSVVTMLLHDYGSPRSIALNTALPDLQQLFWKQTINRVAETIDDQLALARQALQQCKLYMNISELENWLVGIERSTILARKTRDETVDFIRGFGGSNGTA